MVVRSLRFGIRGGTFLRWPFGGCSGKKKASRQEEGQSLIEMIFILPLIIVLIVWLMQGVEVVRASAEQQKYVRLNLFLRLNNQAKFAIDALGSNAAGGVNPTPIRRSAMAVEFKHQTYSLKTLAGNLQDFQARRGALVKIISKLGICLRPECN